jgi:hypothetical protein
LQEKRNKNMNKKKLLVITLLIVTAIYYIPIIKSPLAPYDEAVILVGAERVLKGQVPYKDFLTVYGPAQVYTLAALFKVFGVSVTVERIYDIVIKTLLSLIIFLIINQLSSVTTALVGWAMSLIWIEYSYFHAYPVYPAVLFTFISIYVLLFYMKYDRPLYIILSAISIVVAILFRHDLGGLAAVVITLFLLFWLILSNQKSWGNFFVYIATGIITALPVIVYFLLFSDIKAAIYHLILYPLEIPAQQELPYPALSRSNLPFYVFPSALVFGVITSLILIKSKEYIMAAYGVLLISLIGIVFFNQIWARSDTIHLLPSALTGILLSPILLYTWSRMLLKSARLHMMFFVLFIIFFGITLSRPIMKKIKFLPYNYKIEVVNPNIERAKYPLISEDYKKVVAYVKRSTLKDENIYVGVKNHDKFIFNDAIIYFLTERNCATKYHELNPGHTTTLKIQEEIIKELKNNDARLVVLAVRDRYEDNLSGIDMKIDVLDNYISAKYEFREKFGLFEIWMKRNI